MRNIKDHFKFNKQERSGIFFLLLIIVVLQIVYFLLRFHAAEGRADSFILNEEGQAHIERLKERADSVDTFKIYPFNPNFITDYKGYALGMSVAEIDRLHAFRAQNKFANSAEEFQRVTQISDSLLATILPYFKFPEWTKNGKQLPVGKENNTYSNGLKKTDTSPLNHDKPTQHSSPKSDLNTATAEDLKRIYGIGEKLSARIVKFRDRLGGFLIDEQLYDVYGLDPDVVERALKRFQVLQKPDILKININTASVEELSKLVYIQKHVAQDIVDYRNSKGSINSFDELLKITDFPSEKIDRIALYLSL